MYKFSFGNIRIMDIVFNKQINKKNSHKAIDKI